MPPIAAPVSQLPNFGNLPFNPFLFLQQPKVQVFYVLGHTDIWKIKKQTRKKERERERESEREGERESEKQRKKE